MDRSLRRSKRKAGTDNQTSGKKSRPEDFLSEAPREVDLVHYAESHANEIQVLSSKVDIIGGGRNVAQKIPVHMRRRAMSHNVKRLPRSIRALAAHLVGTKVKKPSRYHRRRPKNLLQEYTRRQRKHVWLETHIWHAKRFHMVEKWGYKLPWKPTMKSERACYRAVSRHCLLQDLSFMSCIEIVGGQDNILQGLAHVTNPQTGQTFAAVSCLAGTREGNTIMYESDKYPWNAIGPVSFMWNPSPPIRDKSQNEAANQRQLWIWCHPSIFDQIWKELLDCLNLKETKLIKKEEGNTTESVDKKKEDENTEPFICDKYRTNVVAVDAGELITMKSLTGSLLKFRLTGPQSTAVLVDTLQQANIVPVKQSEEISSWWNGYYGNSEHSIGHVTQREFMESMEACQSPSELPPHCVVAMTVRDPRLTRPVQRTKVVSDEENINQDMSSFRDKLTKDVSTSPLWIESIRDEVTSTKFTDYRIHELKSQKLVPGLPLELGDDESRIPVIVIQRPGVTSLANCRGHSPNLGQGSGFDMLLPKGWGMAFWLALVFRGARCAGLREQECNAYEEKSLLFPNDFPDSVSGCKYQQDLEKEKVDKYNRIPPSKRPNFTKYGVVSPFSCPWDLLVKEWKGREDEDTQHDKPKQTDESETDVNKEVVKVTGEIGNDMEAVPGSKMSNSSQSNEELNKTSQFYVLRNSKLLRKLQNICQVERYRPCQKGKVDVKVDVLNTLETEHYNAVVAVRLDMVQKGCPGQFSTVCVPSKEDIEQFNKNKSYGGPVEPLHVDPVLIEKKDLQKQMKQKGLKKKVKVDRSLKLIAEKEGVTVRAGCRDVIGYLNSGGFSLGTGNGGGVGFVSSMGLVDLVRNSRESEQGPLVLVRGNSSLQYRFARLSIII
ncbi:ribonucleases P/MRP protein subunit POP1-like [Mercenaria mercenaria]|uniref:ribonucleases P/MRP protein subunit POP1-like n=1 Tax=Mercenaria mercenaria TaxID=6596 RepID=UPI00234EC0AB|nr:ribonucleases P/MRP protein subunit POP1-like [Mercenaria mercenaria]XP_045157726.2 ribonucleases P/MRP protein subunit POP1-like [Mercenaria mercenaria]